MVSCTPSWFWGPVVTLEDCLAAFFAADELKGEWTGLERGWGGWVSIQFKVSGTQSQCLTPAYWAGSGTAYSRSPTTLKLLGVPLFSFIY